MFLLLLMLVVVKERLRALQGEVRREGARALAALGAAGPPRNGGNGVIRGTTRRRHAARRLRVVQNPPPTPMWGCRGTAKYGGGAARRWRGRGSVGPGTVPGTVAGRQTRQDSPGTAPPPLNPRQNSPSNLKNVKFGVFRARRANFFAHNPTTADAWSAGESKRPGRGARGRRQGTAIARQPARGLRQSTTLFAQQQPRQATSGTKLSPHVRYKTLPARATRPHFRYKTLPARPKWLNLALFLHAGRVLYRCHHQEAEQGEFCTERAAEIERANTTHQAPPVWKTPEGPEGPAAVQAAGSQGQHVFAGPAPDKFRMQFDWTKIQQTQKTLQFQRCKFNV